jgi:hypothetical protein
MTPEVQWLTIGVVALILILIPLQKIANNLAISTSPSRS